MIPLLLTPLAVLAVCFLWRALGDSIDRELLAEANKAPMQGRSDR